MNPDKLFDYLDGKLSDAERAELESRLVSEPELQRELATAREIHFRMRETREALQTVRPRANTDRGAILGRRIAIVFATLVFLNVLFGIYAIGFMEKKRRAPTTNEQNQQQLSHALQSVAATALPTPNLEIEEIKVPATRAERDAVAAKIIAAATECGGSAAKNLSDDNGLLLFAEIPAAEENNFRDRLASLGAAPSKTGQGSSPGERRIMQIRVVEQSGR